MGFVVNREILKQHGGCSSAGRAPGCGPGRRGFKSRHSPHGFADHSSAPALLDFVTWSPLQTATPEFKSAAFA
jgi:hypothetical protein